MLRIPMIYIKDKQAFCKKDGILKVLGKPIDIAKNLKRKGYLLLHVVDLDALSGNSSNMDLYDALTYIMNIQVECAAQKELVKKLLAVRCRVVISSHDNLPEFREKNLIVAKITAKNTIPEDFFSDVILENPDSVSIEKFRSLGKRVMVFEKDRVGSNVWGIIISCF